VAIRSACEPLSIAAHFGTRDSSAIRARLLTTRQHSSHPRRWKHPVRLSLDDSRKLKHAVKAMTARGRMHGFEHHQSERFCSGHRSAPAARFGRCAGNLHLSWSLISPIYSQPGRGSSGRMFLEIIARSACRFWPARDIEAAWPHSVHSGSSDRKRSRVRSRREKRKRTVADRTAGSRASVTAIREDGSRTQLAALEPAAAARGDRNPPARENV